MPEQLSWRAATSTVHLLHRASQGMDEIFLRTVGGDITPRQFVILDAVAEAEGLNQVAITQATGIDRSSTAELVQRLTRRGLLRRRRVGGDAVHDDATDDQRQHHDPGDDPRQVVPEHECTVSPARPTPGIAGPCGRPP